MSQTAVHVFTENWMKPVENKDDIPVYYLGVVNAPNTLAVVLQKGGGCRFFCQVHKRIYHPLEACPECAGKLIDNQPAA